MISREIAKFVIHQGPANQKFSFESNLESNQGVSPAVSPGSSNDIAQSLLQC